jgi:hypothetical protein
MTVDLLLWDFLGSTPSWAHGAVHTLPPGVAGASTTVEAVVSETDAAWLLFWDPALGPPPEDALPALTAGRSDVVHAGLSLGMGGLPDDLDLVQPLWWFGVDPPDDRLATSWRLSLRACMVRVDVIRALGGIDPAFRSHAGAGLDLGWRYLARGAMVAHDPRLIPVPAPAARPVTLPLGDRHLFLRRHYAPKWAAYVATRRALAGRPVAELRAYRHARLAPPATASAVYARAGEGALEAGTVTVVLPTLGRPELVAEVLDDLRRQTIAPAQIVVVDQNHARERGPYERFADLPLEVVRQTERGQWLARNAAIARATGDFILFLDDDSRLEPDFVEEHLRCLATYRADVSAGASLSVVGAPVPANYGFFRAADQFDSGNALVRRHVLEQVGAFDRQYDRMRAGDADFGTRAYLAGALAVHNPRAARVHLKAATGGLRTFGSWDAYRQRGLFTPRPLPSVVYYSRRYFSPRQAREALVIGLAQSVVPYHLKRRATGLQWGRALVVEALTLPFSIVRVARSLAGARRMLAQGPRIPAVPARAEVADA